MMTTRMPRMVKNRAPRWKKISYGALIGIGVCGGVVLIGGWARYQWCEANPSVTECAAQWKQKEEDRALAARYNGQAEQIRAQTRETNRCAMYSWFGLVKIRDELPPGCSVQR